MTVYVYKEYDDELAYGEELIRVFARKEDAEAYLQKRFCSQMSVDSIEEYADSFGEFMDNMDTISKDCISLSTEFGTVFWGIQEHEVL